MTTESRLPARMERWRPVLEMVALVFVIVTCITMLAIALLPRILPSVETTTRAATGATPPPMPAPAPLPVAPVSIAGAAIRGNPTARVAIIGYSDYQCPYCARFANETLPGLERTYLSSGQVLFAFKHLPIESIHRRAVAAAEAAECAGRQGLFWPMHDRLFADPKRLEPEDIQTRAVALSLDLAAFDRCTQGQSADRVRADVAEAKSLGIAGTPTFFIGTVDADGRVKVVEQLRGAQPLAAFAAIIDRLLDNARKSIQ